MYVVSSDAGITGMAIRAALVQPSPPQVSEIKAKTVSRGIVHAQKLAKEYEKQLHRSQSPESPDRVRMHLSPVSHTTRLYVCLACAIHGAQLPNMHL